MKRIALLADRLRVEERLLTAAFEARDYEVVLLPPAGVHLSLEKPSAGQYDLALDRGVSTPERATLAALLAAGGTTVINRTATTRLLADRLALLRHLIIGQIPVPETAVSFGEEATFAAIEALGYPVLLKSLSVDPAVPTALVEDQDAAEAIVEHRSVLGGERAVLVQRFVRGQGRSVRLVIAGRDLAGVEMRPLSGWRPAGGAAYEPYAGSTADLESLAGQVVSRLGSGTYAIEVVEAAAGPVVVGVGNLVDFRSLQDRGVDVAGMIADFAISQLEQEEEGNKGG